MLVLKIYKPDEFVTIGTNIRVHAKYAHGGIALAIDAPKEIPILRSTAKNKGAPHAKDRMPLPQL